MKTKVDYNGNKVNQFKTNDVGDYYNPGTICISDDFIIHHMITPCDHPKCKNQYRQRLYRCPNGEWNILNVHFCSKTCEDDFINKYPSSKLYYRVCQHCGMIFTTYDRERLFCNTYCKDYEQTKSNKIRMSPINYMLTIEANQISNINLHWVKRLNEDNMRSFNIVYHNYLDNRIIE